MILKKCSQVLNKGANKLVLDFRGNIGGLVVEAGKISECFFTKRNCGLHT